MRTGTYKKLLIWFFVAMAAFTFLSRAADSLTVAKVLSEKPKPATLAYSAFAEPERTVISTLS